jgi:hypothetical protein
VHLCKNETLAQVAAGFGVSTATAGRYVSETVDLLAERAPSLHEALRELPPEGFVILDGTLITTDRIAADEPYYSMKHRRHGMNVQVIARPDGTPLWFSRATPGRTHDLTAARAHGVIQACLSRQLLVLADAGLDYWYHLAEAPGIKLGGYPGWTQEPCWPECEACGGRMEHLLTVASWEFDGESWRTWLPVEDRTDSGWAEAADNPAGLCLGDAGGVYVFECRACPDRPVGHWFDCS